MLDEKYRKTWLQDILIITNMRGQCYIDNEMREFLRKDLDQLCNEN